MRYLARLLVAVCLCASMIRAQDQSKFLSAQQEVLDAHKARVEASEKRDYATYSRLVADDCMHSDDDGVLDTNPKRRAATKRKPHARGEDWRLRLLSKAHLR